jgi:hypothetical protein
MNVVYLNADVSEKSREWTGVIEARYYSLAMGDAPLVACILVTMEDIVDFIEALDVNTTHIHFDCKASCYGMLEDMPSLERFHNLVLVLFTDFCDLTDAPRISAECVNIRYILKCTINGRGIYETFPTGDWNVLIISNCFIENLHWPRTLSQLVLVDCEIRDVSPPEGGTAAGGDINTIGCYFINPVYEEMWNTRGSRRVARHGLQLDTLDYIVSLDNFALMRQCTLRNFARLAVETTGVNVTDVGVPKINSAAALASNVLRRAAEFLYF